MLIDPKEFEVNGLKYSIRSALSKDAEQLSELRLLIDGETENMNRERGEAYLDEAGFEEVIRTDSEMPHNLFLVCEADDQLVGFSRCEGNDLKRFAHKVEFGVCVRRDYWRYGIGTNLLKESIAWADSIAIGKMSLNVLETNVKAIELYRRHGFEVEGILRRDRIHADGKYYNTIVMGRLHPNL